MDKGQDPDSKPQFCEFMASITACSTPGMSLLEALQYCGVFCILIIQSKLDQMHLSWMC